MGFVSKKQKSKRQPRRFFATGIEESWKKWDSITLACEWPHKSVQTIVWKYTDRRDGGKLSRAGRVCPRSRHRSLLEFLDAEFAEAFGGGGGCPPLENNFEGWFTVAMSTFVRRRERVHSPEEKPGVEKATREWAREREEGEWSGGEETPRERTRKRDSCFTNRNLFILLCFLPVLLLSAR